jgi:hypothetical protein
MLSDAAALARGYLLLGLRFGRLVDGFVDCYIGDPGLRTVAYDEVKRTPKELMVQAAELLRAVPDCGLEPSRESFLRAQLVALQCTARRLAGEAVPFLEEIELSYQVSIELSEPDDYAAVHADIDDLIPGPGSLRTRLMAAHLDDRVPPERLGEVIGAVAGALRRRCEATYPLPPGEHADFAVVTDRPWNAFNRYLGGLRSEITLNRDVGHRLTAMPFVASHEAYPGHHAEHCVKDLELCNRRGWQEHAIALVGTPQCLTTEGMAEQALYAALGAGWGRWTEEVLAGLGLRFDGERAERLEIATGRLLRARQDAAVMLHDRGAGEAEVIAYLCRWMLVSEERARQMLRFLADPLWRSYTTTYIEGSRLVRRWLDSGRGRGVAERYRHLLYEPVLPADMQNDAA